MNRGGETDDLLDMVDFESDHEGEGMNHS